MEDGRTVVRFRSATAIVNGEVVMMIRNQFTALDARIDGVGECVSAAKLTVRLRQANGVAGAAVGFDNMRVHGVAVDTTACIAPVPTGGQCITTYTAPLITWSRASRFNTRFDPKNEED